MIVPFLLALSLVPSAAPTASDKRPAWVILVKSQGDIPASWRETLTRAATEDDTKSWMPPPSVTLEEAQIALGCAAWNDSCAGQVASMTGAAMALVIDIAAQGPGAVLSIQKVRGGGNAAAPADKLELAGRDAADLEWATAFVAGVLRDERRGILSVESDVPGANVFLDGKPLGKTPWRGPVAEGVHTLGLRQEGKAPLTKSIAVKGAVVNSEVLTMNAAGISVAVSPSVGESASPSGGGNSTLGWSLAGVGGALALGGLAVGSPWAWNLFFNREACGPNGDPACLPTTVDVIGFKQYKGAERAEFFSDAGTWLSVSVATLGVGALLIGTGVVLATGDSGTGGEEAEAAAAAGR